MNAYNVPEVHYHGAMWSGTGYAEAARNAVIALDRAGIRVKADPSGFTKATIEVRGGGRCITVRKHQTNKALKLPFELRERISILQHTVVDEFAPEIVHAPSPIYPRYGSCQRKLIGYSAWETLGMPRIWVDGFNRADEVWIPCFHNLKVLRDSGVRRPIYVIPHVVDTERFRPSFRLNGMFTFVSVFRWGLRKGWPELFTAYERAFTGDDPVILRVLTNYRSDEHREQAEKIIEHFKLPGKPRVEFLPTEFITYDFMPILYQNADVFVLPSRGEGFCLPCAEAMACGLPAIVTNASAFTDYVDETNGYPLSWRLETSEDETDPDRADTGWTVVEIDDLSAKMRTAFTDTDERLRKGIAARETIIAKYRPEVVARMMIGRIAANA